MVLVLLGLLTLIGMVNRLALLADYLLFPGFKFVTIRRPLFIVGPPRNGTTLLHRLLASETELFTTFPLWELLLAPAVWQKYLLIWLERIDRRTGGRLQRLVAWVERRCLSGSDHIHFTSLASPEEDYLSLLNHHACFLLVMAFPRCDQVWNLAYLDTRVSLAARTLIVKRYRALLQRHLYVRGQDRYLLSKNPAFCSWIETLESEFPDARFVAPLRDPTETIASQLSSLQPTMASFGYDIRDPNLTRNFTKLLHFYYRRVFHILDALPVERRRRLSYTELTRCSPEVLSLMLTELRYEHTEWEELTRAVLQSQRARPPHRYTLEEYGLNAQRLRRELDAAVLELIEHQSGSLVLDNDVDDVMISTNAAQRSKITPEETSHAINENTSVSP